MMYFLVILVHLYLVAMTEPKLRIPHMTGGHTAVTLSGELYYTSYSSFIQIV